MKDSPRGPQCSVCFVCDEGIVLIIEVVCEVDYKVFVGCGRQVLVV